jgi:hypothetical protein
LEGQTVERVLDPDLHLREQSAMSKRRSNISVELSRLDRGHSFLLGSELNDPVCGTPAFFAMET